MTFYHHTMCFVHFYSYRFKRFYCSFCVNANYLHHSFLVMMTSSSQVLTCLVAIAVVLHLSFPFPEAFLVHLIVDVKNKMQLVSMINLKLCDLLSFSLNLCKHTAHMLIFITENDSYVFVYDLTWWRATHARAVCAWNWADRWASWWIHSWIDWPNAWWTALSAKQSHCQRIGKDKKMKTKREEQTTINSRLSTVSILRCNK